MRPAALALIAVAGLSCTRAPTPEQVEADHERAILARHVVDASVNREWLASDVALIAPIARAWPPRDASAMPWRRSGGHVTCDLDAWAFEGVVGEASFVCVGSTESWPLLRDVLLDAAGATARDTGRGVSLGFRDEALLSRARDVRHADLGAIVPANVPGELREAYELLTSPLAALDLGSSCGEVGTPGRGHSQTRALLDARRFDLLRNVARGLNREGRAFAARALSVHARPVSVDDAALIAKIRASTESVRQCEGCGMGFALPRDVVPDPAVPIPVGPGLPALD